MEHVFTLQVVAVYACCTAYHNGGKHEGSKQGHMCGRYAPAPCQPVVEYCESLTQECRPCSERCGANYPDNYCTGMCPDYMDHQNVKIMNNSVLNASTTGMPGPSSPMTKSLIAGITAISVILVVIIIGFLWYLQRRKNKPTIDPETPNNGMAMVDLPIATYNASSEQKTDPQTVGQNPPANRGRQPCSPGDYNKPQNQSMERLLKNRETESVPYDPMSLRDWSNSGSSMQDSEL